MPPSPPPPHPSFSGHATVMLYIIDISVLCLYLDTESGEPKSQEMRLPVGSFNMPLDVLSSQGDCDDVSTMVS